MDETSLALARACKGFLDEEEGLRLHALAREHAALGPVLEIGSYCGKSAVYLGTGAKAKYLTPTKFTSVASAIPSTLSRI